MDEYTGNTQETEPKIERRPILIDIKRSQKEPEIYRKINIGGVKMKKKNLIISKIISYNSDKRKFKVNTKKNHFYNNETNFNQESFLQPAHKRCLTQVNLDLSNRFINNKPNSNIKENNRYTNIDENRNMKISSNFVNYNNNISVNFEKNNYAFFSIYKKKVPERKISKNKEKEIFPEFIKGFSKNTYAANTDGTSVSYILSGRKMIFNDSDMKVTHENNINVLSSKESACSTIEKKFYNKDKDNVNLFLQSKGKKNTILKITKIQRLQNKKDRGSYCLSTFNTNNKNYIDYIDFNYKRQKNTDGYNSENSTNDKDIIKKSEIKNKSLFCNLCKSKTAREINFSPVPLCSKYVENDTQRKSYAELNLYYIK